MAEDLIRRKIRRLLARKGSKKPVVDMLARFGHEIFAMRREIRVLHRTLLLGAQAKRPWERVTTPARSKLVYAVHELLVKEPKLEINAACEVVWKRLTGGYPNVEALTSYCYSVKTELVRPEDLC